MPYKNAPYYILVVIAVILAGFWTSYFAPFTTVPWQFHAHGIAASIWVLMVLAQSMTIHKGQLPIHRAVGKSSLILFPFLIGGLAAIIDVTGKGFVEGGDAVRTMFGGAFLAGLVVAIAAYVVLYYRALKYRRKVWLHSGYMLGTPLILWESPFSRVMIDYLPSFAINGPQDFPRIMPAILWAMATAVAFCLVVRWRVGERATPFIVTAAFIVAEMVAMGLMGDLAIVRSALVVIGNAPSAAVVLTGFAIGAATSWIGWQAGKRSVMPAGAVQAA